MSVSVIIPAYNSEKTIGTAIRSVLGQSFQDFEIIVVDDGSQDGTSAAVKAIHDPRIKLLQHARNSGASQARNTGIKSSSGSYIAFLDSDDEWLPAKLSKQIEAVSQVNEGLTASVCGYFLYDEFNILRQEIPTVPGSWSKHLLLGCGLAAGSTLFVSREAFGQVGYFDEQLPRYTDWDWLLRFTRNYPIAVVPELLAVIHRNTVPRASTVERSAIRLIEKHGDQFESHAAYGRRAIAKRFLEISLLYFMEKNKQEGWKWFRRALAKNWIQRPGMLLRIIDAVLGTSIIPTLIRIRERMHRQSK